MRFSRTETFPACGEGEGGVKRGRGSKRGKGEAWGREEKEEGEGAWERGKKFGRRGKVDVRGERKRTWRRGGEGERVEEGRGRGRGEREGLLQKGRGMEG